LIKVNKDRLNNIQKELEQNYNLLSLKLMHDDFSNIKIRKIIKEFQSKEIPQ